MRVPHAVQHFGEFSGVPQQPQYFQAALLFTQRVLQKTQRITQKIGDRHYLLLGHVQQIAGICAAGFSRHINNTLRAITQRDAHIDLDRGNPSCQRHRLDDSGSTEDRNSAQNTQPWVKSFSGDYLAVFATDSQIKICRFILRQHFGHGLPHHLARHRINRRFAYRHSQTGLRRGTDAAPGEETNLPHSVSAHLGKNSCAVGVVRVVAAILEYFGAHRLRVEPAQILNRHRQKMCAIGQGHIDLRAVFAAQ